MNIAMDCKSCLAHVCRCLAKHSVAVLLGSLALATLLHGCSNDDSLPVTKTTVIVMRHCVRSTPGNEVDANHSYTYDNNYSHEAWPPFIAPAWYCLPRGEDIVEAQGKWFASNGDLLLPLRAIADDVPVGQRDKVTMERFLKGLSLSANSVTSKVNGLPFRPASTSSCTKARPTSEEMLDAMKVSLDHPALPAGYEEDMQLLYNALEAGVAQNWTGIPCTAALLGNEEMPMPAGACQAAAEFSERLLMEWGGGMNIGWGRIKADQLPDLLRLHSFHFQKWFGLLEIAKWYGASIIRDVASRLNVAEAGTTLYVGHDSDIMMLNRALGLSWNAKPFPVNATLPGSMLRFDREGDTITASYMYVANFSNKDGVMLSVPALFNGSSNNIAASAFARLAEQNSVEQCANVVESAAAADLRQMIV